MSDELHPNGATPTPPVLTVSKKRKGNFLLTIYAILFGFWVGWSVWKTQPSTTRTSSAEQWEDKTIAPRFAGLRQQLGAIESRPVNNVDEYIANTLETRPIVDEALGLTRLEMGMITRFKQAHQGNASDVRTANYMMRLAEKDEQFMHFLADEVQCAKDLKTLPAGRRLAYYNANVPPIKNKEAQLMKEFSAIVNDAKANGIPLPASVDPQSEKH